MPQLYEYLKNRVQNMCGIAGLSIAAGDYTLKGRSAAAAMLLAIQSRGRDATGAAWLAADGDVKVTKLPVEASTFLTHREEHLPGSTPAMILHTRFGTHGSSENRDNLHPVIHDSIIGVHNGVLRNHDDLFKMSNRTPTSEVDTEGLMALLNADEHPAQTLGAIRGDAAVAWIDLRAPEYLHLACVTGRPLVIAQTKQGSLLFGSTENTVKKGAEAGGVQISFMETVKEETYIKVKDGMILEYQRIDNVVHSSKAFKQQFAWTSGTPAGTSVTPEFSSGGKTPSACPA